MSIPTSLPSLRVMTLALIAHWQAKVGRYRDTDLGVQETKHGGPGGTYKEVNERRAREKVRYYQEVIDLLNAGATATTDTVKMSNVAKDYKRLIKGKR